MPKISEETMVVAVSARALFDLESDARLFAEQGLDAYAARQRSLEEVPLEPGSAFPLVQGLLQLNAHVPTGEPPFVEVVVLSSQHPDTGLRVLGSIRHHGLSIARAVFTGGAPTAPYLVGFRTGLFLTRSAVESQAAADLGVASATMYDKPEASFAPDDCVRIAFDGDKVLFGAESEDVYQRDGLAAFNAHEAARTREPMQEGPHGAFLRGLQRIRAHAPKHLRIALITARGAPSDQRALRTLRSWGIGVDEAFFLDGMPKQPFVSAFQAAIFFDDQNAHLASTSSFVPCGHVPYRLARAGLAATVPLC